MSEVKNRLNIPERLLVGFQKRSDTYSKKLAYVTYYRKKGSKEEIAKESSWRGWIREKDYPIENYDNVPTEGFVLNKHVGGCKSGWDFRKSYCRIYDPRGFEFEISLENLLFILEECDCLKGKGLMGSFVYAWDGKDLVLLPTSSVDYVESTKFNKKVAEEKVTSKDLVIGALYSTKNDDDLIYIGRKDTKMLYHANEYRCFDYLDGKYYLFYNQETKNVIGYKSISSNILYKISDSIMSLADCEQICDNYIYTKENPISKELLDCSKAKKFNEQFISDFINYRFDGISKVLGDEKFKGYSGDKYTYFFLTKKINETTYETYKFCHNVSLSNSTIAEVLYDKKFGKRQRGFSNYWQYTRPGVTQNDYIEYRYCKKSGNLGIESYSQEYIKDFLDELKDRGLNDMLYLVSVCETKITGDKLTVACEKVSNYKGYGFYNELERSTYSGVYKLNEIYKIKDILEKFNSDNTYITLNNIGLNQYDEGDVIQIALADGVYDKKDVQYSKNKIMLYGKNR